MFIDYYKLLEVRQNATFEEIKKAFREQAIKWHPDRNQGKDTTLYMQEINEAYLILKDFEARERYDFEYNKFRKYQQNNTQAENEQTKTEKGNNYQEQNNSRKQYEYSDYEVEDHLLAKWISNAKTQAVELAKQTIKDFKGVTRAAANGCFNGIIQLFGWVVVVNLIFILFKSCNN